MSDDVIVTDGLTKKYGRRTAVDGIAMNVRKGDIYGFLGQNGAGKTTTIRMLMNLIKPSSGEIRLFGEWVRPGVNRLYGRIGSIIEYPGFYPNLTAAEQLDMHRRLCGVRDKGSVEEALAVTGLWEARNRKVGQFSLGMKQRLGLARALLPKPELLVLDEPTNGLDPLGIKELRELLSGLAEKQGLTLLISSHILSEIEQLATKFGILHNGKLVQELSREELQSRSERCLELRVNDSREALRVLRSEMELSRVEAAAPDVVRVYERFGDASRMNRSLVLSGVEVHRMTLREKPLEAMFESWIGEGDKARESSTAC